MGFVFEKVPEEDWDFFMSMGLKDCWGSNPLNVSECSAWCADRERNAYLVPIGGGFREMPNYYDLWWNGHTIRMEIGDGGNGNYNVGVDLVWFIHKISIPKEIWQYKGEIMNMITDAFSVNEGWCRKECLKSIAVKVMCKAEIAEE